MLFEITRTLKIALFIYEQLRVARLRRSAVRAGPRGVKERPLR
jgi:hypothetical protein